MMVITSTEDLKKKNFNKVAVMNTLLNDLP